jgi:hypothetical protein
MFTNFESRRQEHLDPEKKYLVVYPGLHIKGTCENTKCVLFHRDVWLRQGYGNFDLGIIRCKNKCP